MITVSQPNAAIPSFPLNTNNPPAAPPSISETLASLPEPRKYYAEYYSSAAANADLMSQPEDLASFLRQYFYIKSHAWPGNQNPDPHPLPSADADQLALLPQHYTLPLNATMKDAITSLMASTSCTLSAAEESTAFWLPAPDLEVYVQEFARTGFQGMLNWYRVSTSPPLMAELQLWAGKKVEIPSLFVGGDRDWGLYEKKGALEGLAEANRRFYGVSVLGDCGGFPHMERPEELAGVCLEFLGDIRDVMMRVSR